MAVAVALAVPTAQPRVAQQQRDLAAHIFGLTGHGRASVDQGDLVSVSADGVRQSWVASVGSGRRIAHAEAELASAAVREREAESVELRQTPKERLTYTWRPVGQGRASVGRPPFVDGSLEEDKTLLERHTGTTPPPAVLFQRPGRSASRSSDSIGREVSSSTVAALASVSLDMKPQPSGRCGMRLSADATVLGYSIQGGPAERAGVPLGSRILKLDGVSVHSKADFAARLLTSSQAGSSRSVSLTCELRWLSQVCQALVFAPGEGEEGTQGPLSIKVTDPHGAVYQAAPRGNRRRGAAVDDAVRAAAGKPLALHFSLGDVSHGGAGAPLERLRLQAQALSFLAGLAGDARDLSTAANAAGWLRVPTLSVLLGSPEAPGAEMRAVLDICRVLSLRDEDCLRGLGADKLDAWLQEGGGRLTTGFIKQVVQHTANTQPVRSLRKLCGDHLLSKAGDTKMMAQRLVQHHDKLDLDLEVRALQLLQAMANEEAERIKRSPGASLPGAVAEMARRAEMVSLWCDRGVVQALS